MSPWKINSRGIREREISNFLEKVYAQIFEITYGG